MLPANDLSLLGWAQVLKSIILKSVVESRLLPLREILRGKHILIRVWVAVSDAELDVAYSDLGSTAAAAALESASILLLLLLKYLLLVVLLAICNVVLQSLLIQVD